MRWQRILPKAGLRAVGYALDRFAAPMRVNESVRDVSGQVSAARQAVRKGFNRKQID